MKMDMLLDVMVALSVFNQYGRGSFFSVKGIIVRRSMLLCM